MKSNFISIKFSRILRNPDHELSVRYDDTLVFQPNDFEFIERETVFRSLKLKVVDSKLIRFDIDNNQAISDCNLKAEVIGDRGFNELFCDNTPIEGVILREDKHPDIMFGVTARKLKIITRDEPKRPPDKTAHAGIEETANDTLGVKLSPSS